jgi:hypothetical protein
MTLPSLDNLIGRQLRDSYGRYFGTIAGITVDESGGIRSIGIDTGSDGFQTIDGSKIAIDDDSLVLISDWKQKADKLMKTSGLAQKKMQALEELHNEGEISQEVFEQLAGRHKSQFDLYSNDCDEAVASLNATGDTLRNENKTVASFLGTVKLQHRIQEIDDAAFQSTYEYLDTILQRNDKEIADVSATLDSLTPSETISPEETVSVEEPVPEATDAPTPEVEAETIADVNDQPESDNLEESSGDDIPNSETPIPEVTSAEGLTTQFDESTSANTESIGGEDLDISSNDSSDSIETPIETSSLPEDISEETADQTFESPSMDHPEAPDLPTESEQDTSDNSETLEYGAQEGATDLSDRMPLDDTVQVGDISESYDSDNSSEITDSVSFQDEVAESSDFSTSDDVAETPDDSNEPDVADDVAETPDDSNEPEVEEEDNVVYSTQ